MFHVQEHCKCDEKSCTCRTRVSYMILSVSLTFYKIFEQEFFEAFVFYYITVFNVRPLLVLVREPM